VDSIDELEDEKMAEYIPQMEPDRANKYLEHLEYHKAELLKEQEALGSL